MPNLLFLPNFSAQDCSFGSGDTGTIVVKRAMRAPELGSSTGVLDSDLLGN